MAQVVLLDDHGRPAGTADAALVHRARTPLHLAVSCFVFDPGGRLLLTLPADTQPVWPGRWAHSCHGHPAPGEPVPAAVTRTLRAELGLTAAVADPVLPSLRYHAVMDDGVAENVIAPVYRVVTDRRPDPDPRAVADFEWVAWTDFLFALSVGDIAVSPWCRLQAAALAALGDDPAGWAAADRRLLPGGALAAAR